jgi:ferric-dicitrate binding protein FerR (iron transport regulator)
MNDELLGKYFSEPGNFDFETNQELEGYGEEAIAKTRKVVEHIELLKQMESVDSEKALLKIKAQIQKKQKFNYFKMIRQAAAILLLPVTILSVWQASTIHKQKESIVENTIVAPPTLRSEFTLPDGTKVWLNGSSSLKYPTRFTGSKRIVELEGEAYFQVAPDRKKPFLGETSKLIVEAVGTEFNCMAFSHDKTIEVVLTEGKVNILQTLDQERKPITSLTPNQRIIFNKDNNKLVRQNVDPTKYIAWREGKLIFQNDGFQEVLSRLERWYNVDFIADIRQDKDYAFTGSFEGEELSNILNYIELTTPVRFRILKKGKDQQDRFSKLKIQITNK